jgi:hypothetical protein
MSGIDPKRTHKRGESAPYRRASREVPEPEQFEQFGISASVIHSIWSGAVKETNKQYFNRRAKEERKRARSAKSSESSTIHDELADLCHERAHGSANVNGKTGIRPESRISD